jgi:anti-sigma factor RsiW
MICSEVRKYLDTFIDGELEAGLMLGVESHVEGCETCNSIANLKRRLKRELHNLARVEAPAHLRNQVLETAVSSRRKKALIGALALPLAAAAAVVVMLNLPAAEPAPEQLSSVVDDVVQHHVRELPMEVKGPDPVQAESWFRGKVDFPVRANALRLENASFEGARLSNVRAQQAAHMVYNVDGRRVTLMIFNTRVKRFIGGKRVEIGGKDVLLGKQNGYNVAVLLDGDMAYVLSSDLSQDRLLDLVRDIAR